MKILSITAGAAGMYCGSCARDNALAAELMARGHDVTLIPLYAPTTTYQVPFSFTGFAFTPHTATIVGHKKSVVGIVFDGFTVP